MKPNTNIAAAETVQTKDSPAVVQERLVLPLRDAGSAIPMEVAVCPECGGKLTLMEDFDASADSQEPPSMDCENEPEAGHEEWDTHRWWQSDWQPVIDKVRAYLRGQNV